MSAIPGTLWLVLVLALTPEIVAVTRLVEGMPAFSGTVKVVSKVPLAVVVVETTVLPA